MKKYTKPYPTIGNVIDTERLPGKELEKYLEKWKKTRENTI